MLQTAKTQYPSVNFEKDWKLLTIFIGANNLCGACKGDANTKPAFFEENLRADLQLLEKNFPRTFVNVVGIFNVSGVW